MEDYNIMDEAGMIDNQRAKRQSDHINFPDTAWATASDETKSLLIEIQQLVKSLEDACREAAKQGDEARKLLLYQRIAGRPHLTNTDLELYDGQECIEREIEFIIRAKLWIGEVEGLL